MFKKNPSTLKTIGTSGTSLIRQIKHKRSQSNNQNIDTKHITQTNLSSTTNHITNPSLEQELETFIQNRLKSLPSEQLYEFFITMQKQQGLAPISTYTVFKLAQDNPKIHFIGQLRREITDKMVEINSRHTQPSTKTGSINSTRYRAFIKQIERLELKITTKSNAAIQPRH